MRYRRRPGGPGQPVRVGMPAPLQGMLEPENQEELAGLLKRVRETYPDKDIWCYTGYLYDVDLSKGGKVYTEVTEEMLSYIDVLVDGEFIEEEKDVTLVFRGSRNQRIIELGKEEALYSLAGRPPHRRNS